MKRFKKQRPTDGLNRRGFLKGLSASFATAAVIGCGKDDEAKPETVDPAGGNAGASGDGDKAGAAPKTKLDALKSTERLRFSLTELAHFAARSSEGVLAIQLGDIAARKHTNGGWNSGWDITPREDKGERYFEANSKTSRVFFKHSKNDYDRIVVRMKAVKSGNKVTFYVNDEAISTVDIDGDWKDYVVDVPSKARNNGENQLMMRFKHDTTKDGRKQAAHVSAVYVLPKGKKVKQAPAGPRLQKVDFGGVSHDALFAATPQTYTFRMNVPEGTPKLGVAFGAKAAGATFEVTASSDTTSEKSLMSTPVDAGKAGAWQTAVLSLSDFAGQVAEINMTVKGDWKVGDQLAAWGSPGIYTPPVKDGAKAAKNPGKPAKNVVVYLIDTLRYDKFKFYNKKSRAKTPNIDAFAADATIFDAAYDNENWTKPSTATILTGLLPDTHGAKKDDSKLSSKATMISEHFKTKGFKTGAFLSNGYVSDAFGFKQGWDHYRNYIREKTKTDADRVVEDGLKWINENKDGRFFAYLHTIDPHVPYNPPQKYRDMYWKGSYNGPIKPNATGDQLAQIKTKKMSVTREDKRYLESLYDAETTFNDFAFGELVKGLKAAGVYDDTVIVIIADHGEEFWDHGKVGHGHSLYEELIHSPLIVRYPNKFASGRRVPHVVSMVDLAPSLFEITGIEGHDDLEGTSWADVADGIGNPHPRVALSDFLERRKSLRAGRYKWISIGRNGDLYDVVSDPGEKKDLIKKHQVARAFMRTQLGMYMGATDKSSWWANTQKTRDRKALKADQAEIDGDLRKQLEDLGYVGDAAAPK